MTEAKFVGGLGAVPSGFGNGNYSTGSSLYSSPVGLGLGQNLCTVTNPPIKIPNGKGIHIEISQAALEHSTDQVKGVEITISIRNTDPT
jgi:hypothetical protein